MGSQTVTARLGAIEAYRFNPAGIQRASLESVRAINEGTIEIVDATNPFVNCIETSAVNTAGFMQHMAALHRRQYAAASSTAEDLYLHMSDKDYVDRFAMPASAPFVLMLNKTELMRALVLDPATGIRKLTLPRNTFFKIADTSFSLQYPVDIRLLPHGALQVVYDAAQPSPLQSLSTNLVENHELTHDNGTTYLQLILDTRQFFVTSRYNDVTSASGSRTTLTLTDQFHFARVFSQQDNGTWRELRTTHSQQVYDATIPTAVLKVLDGVLQVVIPVIYTTTGQVRNKLRIDVYETKGAVDMLLGNYAFSDFSVTWRAIDTADNTVYTAPLRNLKDMAVYSTAAVNSGRAALSFEELRARVINNAMGPKAIPITTAQLQASLEDAGYEIVKNVDTITNRIFFATRPMPPPADKRLITAAASSVVMTQLSFEELETAHGVNVHTHGVTLTPDALYHSDNGITRVVSAAAHGALMGLTKAQLCAAINEGTYLYSPFHYVLDATSPSFDVRPYYMDTPAILSKSFVEENPSTGLQVSIDATYKIERSPQGYRLTLSTRSNAAFLALSDNEVFAQLSFQASGQTLPAFMLGTQLPREKPTDERVYVFDMTTTFNLDVKHTLDQTSFSYSPSSITTRSDLLQELRVYFGTTANLGVSLGYSALDNRLGRYQLPSNAIGLAQENLRVRFGHALSTLWSRGRSVVASVPYETHVQDVPRVYQQDAYELDPVTGAAFSVVNGELVYNLLHRKNDPVLDDNGQPVFQYRVGDPVLDATGAPVPKSGYTSQMLRHVDITAIEGAYRFATDSVAVAYRKLLTDSLVSWLTQDLANLTPALLDRTAIYFYPKVNQGVISIMTRDGVESMVAAGQSLTVELHVPDATYENPTLLATIKKATVTALDGAFKNPTVAISAVQATLRNLYGSDVTDVRISGLGGEHNYQTVTVLDKSSRLSIRKQLTVLPDDQLIVQEDVEFVVINHTVKPRV